MPRIMQEMAKEFPEHVAMLRHLNETDGHFHRISTAYVKMGLLQDDETEDGGSTDRTRFEQLRLHRAALRQEILDLLVQPETVEDILP